MPSESLFFAISTGFCAMNKLSGGICPRARPSRVLCADRRVAPPFGGTCHRRSVRLALGAKSSAIIRAPS